MDFQTLEIQAGPRIPSSFLDTKVIDETHSRPGYGNSHHTILTKGVMVLPAYSDRSWSILETLCNAEPSVSGHLALPRSEEIQMDSLEFDWSIL